MPDVRRALDDEFTAAAAPRRTLDGERLITVFARLVEPIGRALPTSSEVVLHDLSLLPNSIVAVFGMSPDDGMAIPPPIFCCSRRCRGSPNTIWDTKQSCPTDDGCARRP